MEPPLALAVVVAGVSAALLALEIVRKRPVVRAHHRWARTVGPFRSVLVAVLMSSLWASTRAPATASTPPPPVRLAGLGPSAGIAPEVSGATYRVERGDCLWRIARDLLIERGEQATGSDIARAWRAIYDANRPVIGVDPNLIHPGQVFEIPEEL